MSLARYWNGIPSRHITAAIGVQQADFDEELSGLYDDGSLVKREDGMDFMVGTDVVSGIGPRGEIRPRRFVFQLDMGTGAGAGEHAMVPIICTQDGTRVTLMFTGLGCAATAGNTINNLDHLLPAVICPEVTVYPGGISGTTVTTDNLTRALGPVTISPGGLITISPNIANPASIFTAGPTVSAFEPFSVTYDTAKPW